MIPRVLGASVLCLMLLGCGKHAEPESRPQTEHSALPVAAQPHETGAPKVVEPQSTVAAVGEAAEGVVDSSPVPTGNPDPDEAGDDEAGEEISVDALLKQVRSKSTSDEQALVALRQAEKGGAKAPLLAKAANARGETLYATPERAAKFFEWAASKDSKYAEPVFNLAKQAAVRGDIEDVRSALAKVHERGGKKLLDKIEFDPMWEIVRDDPEVRKLVK